MSAAPPEFEITEEEPSDPIEFNDFGTFAPILKDNGNEVEPVYVAELEGTSSGNSEEHRDMCGNSTYEKIGDDRWRITLNGVITKSQLNELKQMRPAEREVKIVSDVHTGYVEFDRFTVTQDDELNYGTFTLSGDTITEPLFKFQLQTRDNEE